MDKLKDKINFLKEGAKGLLKAKFNQMINGKAPDEVIEFRLSQCKSCPLFTGKYCDQTKYGRKDSDEVITQTLIDKYPQNFTEHSVNSVVRQVSVDGDKYTRGCGCPILDTNNKPVKPEFHFTNEELNKKDGTSACPLNKWNEEEFIKYLDKK